MCRVWSRSVQQSRLPIWVKLSATVIFFLTLFSGTRTADAGRSTPTYYKSIDAVWPKDVPFGVSTQKNFIWGVIPEKPPRFGAGIGISSINVQSNNFRTAWPILVIHNSNDASQRKEYGYKGQIAGLLFWELSQKYSPKGSFSANILHSITF